jgi:hypothetical protein
LGLDGGFTLPEGTCVVVSVIESPEKPRKHRADFPLVLSASPGWVQLTNEMIGQILDDNDAAGAHPS